MRLRRLIELSTYQTDCGIGSDTVRFNAWLSTTINRAPILPLWAGIVAERRAFGGARRWSEAVRCRDQRLLPGPFAWRLPMRTPETEGKSRKAARHAGKSLVECRLSIYAANV